MEGFLDEGILPSICKAVDADASLAAWRKVKRDLDYADMVMEHLEHFMDCIDLLAIGDRRFIMEGARTVRAVYQDPTNCKLVGNMQDWMMAFLSRSQSFAARASTTREEEKRKVGWLLTAELWEEKVLKEDGPKPTREDEWIKEEIEDLEYHEAHQFLAPASSSLVSFTNNHETYEDSIDGVSDSDSEYCEDEEDGFWI